MPIDKQTIINIPMIDKNSRESSRHTAGIDKNNAGKRSNIPGIDRKSAGEWMIISVVDRKVEGEAKENAINEAEQRLKRLADNIARIGNEYSLVDLQDDYDTEEFGELEVGLHPLTGDNRESHHVAENKFMEQTKTFYGQVGGNTLSANQNFKDLGDKLIARQRGIEGRFPGGNNLSAILIHEDTHRLAENKAVHSIGLQPDALRNIESFAETNKTIVLVGIDSSTKVKRAQMNEGAWNTLIRNAYFMTANSEFEVKDDGQELVVKSEGNDREALNEISVDLDNRIENTVNLSRRGLNEKKREIKELINNTAKNAYNSALTSGLQTVRAALNSSDKDGDKANYPNALSQLERLADRVWNNNIVKQID